MKGNRPILGCLVAAIATLCFAQAQQGSRPAPGRGRSVSARPAFLQQVKFFEETQNVTKAVLKNDLTVLVNEFRSQPVVAVMAYVKAGYSGEPESSAGVSHVLQHMFYKGARTRESDTARDIKSLGGLPSACARYDHSYYCITAPSAQWKKAIEIQADALFNPRFDAESLKKEIEFIVQEARVEAEDPGSYGCRRLKELGFKSARTRSLASEALLRNLDRDKLLSYFTTAYEPSKVILVVSGDVTAYEVLKEVIRLYGRGKSSAAKPAPPPGEQQTGFRFDEIRGDLEHPLVLMGFHTAPVFSDEYLPLEVLTRIIGEGEGSILNRHLRGRKKAILTGSASLEANSDFGYLTLKMEVMPQDIDKCEIQAFTALEILKRQELDPVEIERAIAGMERSFWDQLETVEGRAHSLARFEALRSWKGMEDLIARLRRVKPADVQNAARKFLRLENCALLEILPKNMEPRLLTADVLGKTVQDLLSLSVEEELAAREKTTEKALVIPPASDTFKFSEVRFPMQRSSVWRGPELFIREDHTAPLVQMGLFFPGGRLAEKKENQGITHLMLRWLLQGSKNTPPDLLYRQLELLGARITPVVEDDYFGLFLSVLSRNIEPSLDLLFEMFKSPRFDPESLSSLKALALSEILREKYDEYLYPCRVVDRALFGEFPYGLPHLGTDSSLAGLTPAQVRDWHKATVENRKPLVVIIGDTQGTSLARYFVRNFSGSRYQDVKLAEEFAKPLEKRTAVDDSWARSESVIAIGFNAPPGGDEDAAALTVLENYVGGVGGRLAEQLRDQEGLVRTVDVRYQPRLRGGEITVYATTSLDAEEKARQRLEEELRRLVETPIPFKEYRAAVNASVGRYRVEQQRRSTEMSRLVRYLLEERGIEELTERPAKLQAVREEELAQVLQRVFKLDRAAVVRIRGGSVRSESGGAEFQRPEPRP